MRDSIKETDRLNNIFYKSTRRCIFSLILKPSDKNNISYLQLFGSGYFFTKMKIDTKCMYTSIHEKAFFRLKQCCSITSSCTYWFHFPKFQNE